MIEKYLSHLRDEFNGMRDTAMEQFSLTRQMLEAGEVSAEAHEKMEENEKKIDRYEVMFRDGIIQTIVLQSPRAGDLRRIISFFDVVVELERVCDLLDSVHRRLREMSCPSIYGHFYPNLLQLFRLSEKMIENAVFAFECESSEIARHVIASDDAVDDLHAQIYADMLLFDDAKRRQTGTLASLLTLNRIAHSIERIGDAATNICEAVVFLVEGIAIKHS
jgi:phosphate transport system protein